MRNRHKLSAKTGARSVTTLIVAVLLAAVGTVASHAYRYPADGELPAVPAGTPTDPAAPADYFPSHYELHAPEPGPHIQAF
jgi:hypothetical protein